ncbi:hypothetical protein CLOM_g3503, partial [Closterium sp. NIES-68]
LDLVLDICPGVPPTFAPDVNDPQSSETAIRTYRASLTDHVRQQLLFEASRAEHDAATAAYNTYQAALAEYVRRERAYITDLAAWRVADRRALTILLATIPPTLKRELAPTSSSHLWRLLTDLYDRQDVATLYSLIKEFQSLTMDSTTGAAAFTRRVLDLARRLAALGVPYPDPVLCCHLLEGLTPAFDTHKIAYMQLIDKRITRAEVAQWIITTEADLLRHSSSIAAAMACPDAHLWLAAILKELEAFIANSSFVDVPRPPSTTNVVKGKWVFRVKQLPGEPPVYKARYVAKGFTQRYAVDFFDTFSPTAKPATIRAVLDLAARLNMEIHSMDVSNAFLQGVLRELIYMERPAGFHLPFPSDSVWQLRRPVYGLKQAPREWHAKLAATLAELGFSTSHADPSLFLRTSPSPFYILVYVDDMILITADSAELERVKRELGSRLKCKDLGELQHYLGMEITRDRAARTISLSQGHYLQQVLERFDMARGTPQVTPLPVGHHLTPLTSPSSSSHPYAELIGSLMYAMVSTRPDLAYPISVLARFVGTGKHDTTHWQAAKRVLRYLRGTKDYVLTLGGPSPPLLTGYSDSSWADSRPDRRSSQGYGFSLGSGLISWRSTRSSSIALSSCEAELLGGVVILIIGGCWLG